MKVEVTWPSWAPVPNKPTVSVEVEQHSTKYLTPDRPQHHGVSNDTKMAIRSVDNLAALFSIMLLLHGVVISEGSMAMDYPVSIGFGVEIHEPEPSTESVFQRSWQVDLMFMDDVVFNGTARSRLDCARLCVSMSPTCVSFSHVQESLESESWVCWGYSTPVTATRFDGMFVSGAKTFSKVGVTAGVYGGEKQDRFMGDSQDRLTGERQDRFIGERQDRLTGERQDRLTGDGQEEFIGERLDGFTGKRQDRFIGERQDRFIGERQDKRKGERQDKIIVERQDKIIGERQDKRKGERQDKRKGERQDKSIRQRQDKRTGERQDYRRDKARQDYT